MNMELVRQLQTTVAPQIFTPRAVYDGRKNVFSVRELPFGPEGTKEVRPLLLLSVATDHLLQSSMSLSVILLPKREARGQKSTKSD